MTNSEIYDNMSKEVQDKIETNCNELNRHAQFDFWIRQDVGEAAIQGAFVWEDTPEGHVYWQIINDKIVELCDQE